MKYDFVAYSVAKELDELNELAVDLGLNRKYRWEEPMILNNRVWPSLFSNKDERERSVYLFSFGSVVFINCESDEIKSLMEKLKSKFPDIDQTGRFVDTYSLQVDGDQKEKITNDYAIIPEFRPNVPDMISTVLAKSVALERIEFTMERVFDEVDDIVERLEQGKLALKDKSIAKLVAKVLNIRLGTLSYVMVLDKPDITWYNILADRFYIELAEVFELIDRHEDINHKSEVIKDTIDSFVDLAHAKRATRLELWIVYLILFEVVFSLFEKGYLSIWNFLRQLFG